MNKKKLKQKKQKSAVKKKIKKQEDRNWVMPPNSITKKGKKNSPSKISYWVDKNGEAQLYTAEQLAICNILMNINVLLSKSLMLIESLQTMDEDTTIRTLVQQDYAQFKVTELSAYANFVQLMAAAPDITFAEFLNFISQGDDSKAFSKIGEKRLKKIIKETSPEFVSFFTSDRLRKKPKL